MSTTATATPTTDVVAPPTTSLVQLQRVVVVWCVVAVIVALACARSLYKQRVLHHANANSTHATRRQWAAVAPWVVLAAGIVSSVLQLVYTLAPDGDESTSWLATDIADYGSYAVEVGAYVVLTAMRVRMGVPELVASKKNKVVVVMRRLVGRKVSLVLATISAIGLGLSLASYYTPDAVCSQALLDSGKCGRMYLAWAQGLVVLADALLLITIFACRYLVRNGSAPMAAAQAAAEVGGPNKHIDTILPTSSTARSAKRSAYYYARLAAPQILFGTVVSITLQLMLLVNGFAADNLWDFTRLLWLAHNVVASILATLVARQLAGIDADPDALVDGSSPLLVRGGDVLSDEGIEMSETGLSASPPMVSTRGSASTAPVSSVHPPPPASPPLSATVLAPTVPTTPESVSALHAASAAASARDVDHDIHLAQ